MNSAQVFSLLPEFLEGTKLVVALFFCTLMLSLPLGLLVAFGRMSKCTMLSRAVGVYVLLMRGTPLLLQLIVVMYAPSYIFGINIPRFWAAVLAFVINYAAYFSEIYRGGISSIQSGQYEAAQVLGFNRVSMFYRIIMPQVLKRITLPMGNEFTTLVKDTALVSTIALVEIFRVAKNASSAYSSLLPLFIAGAIYLLLNAVVTQFFNWFERKQDYYKG